ncbi:MAG: TRAP transporter large permease subunit [Roseobacter sp.]
MLRDLSLPAIYMGVLAAFVGYSASFAIVLAGVTAMGASESQAATGLFFGLLIDAIPTIIILGTVLLPVAIAAEIHPIALAIVGIVGIISLAFGLVTPPCGFCLLISAAMRGMNVVSVMRDVCIILAPILLIIALLEITLWLPRTLMPMTFN